MKEWFEDWFDTDYYKALYSDRNENEADCFVELLVNKLKLQPNCRILDVACGRGRHAMALNQLGYDVTGIDLSFKKIAANLPNENNHLHFYRHDMRHLFTIRYFDAVFNFFTSFGYFESSYDERNAAFAMAANVNWNGYLVIDYFNAAFLRKNLIPLEDINIGPYEFTIRKSFGGGRILKEICIKEHECKSVYYEKVRMYSFPQLVGLFSRHSLKLVDAFGSYQLDPYVESDSERMILIFKKPKS